MTPTIITSVKGRLAHLKESLPTWLEHTPCPIIIATQDCPDGSAEWAQKLGNDRILVASVEARSRGLFNKAQCLNGAAILAWGLDDAYILFLDADTRITPELWPWLEQRLTPESLCFVRPSAEHRDLTGVLGVSVEAFEAVNGYDEGMLGWGSEDLDLRLRLYLTEHLAPVEIPAELFRPIPHDDALRTRFYSEPDKQASQQKNLQRLVDNAERLTGRSIFALLEDPVVHRLFHVPT